MPGRTLDAVECTQALLMAGKGSRISDIARHFGTTWHNAAVAVRGQEYRDKLQEKKAAGRVSIRKALEESRDTVDWAHAKARLREIPSDTRTSMQRLLGDPIPARSALGRSIQRDNV